MFSDHAGVQLRILRVIWSLLLNWIRKLCIAIFKGYRKGAPLQIRRKKELLPSRVENGEIRMGGKPRIDIRVIRQQDAFNVQEIQRLLQNPGIFFSINQ